MTWPNLLFVAKQIYLLIPLSNYNDPMGKSRIIYRGKVTKEVQHKISHAIFLISDWRENLLSLSLGIMDGRVVLAFKAYDWLVSKIRDVNHVDESTYLFIQRLTFTISYYKNSHLESFEDSTRLDSHTINLLYHSSICYSLNLTPFYIGGLRLKLFHTHIIFLSNWCDHVEEATCD